MSTAIFLLVISVALIFISIGAWSEKCRYKRQSMYLKAIAWNSLEFWSKAAGCVLLFFSLIIMSEIL